MAMILFSLWIKLVKMNFFFFESANQFILHVEIKTASLLKRPAPQKA